MKAGSWRFIITIFLLVVLALSSPSLSLAAKKKKKKSYRVTAKAAVLIDAASGRKLYDKNSRQRVLPASTTKVMTALLAMEKLPLNQWVTVSANATHVQPSRINLVPGEQYRVGDLIYASLLNSANDASVVLAEAVAGSQSAFVRLMNRRAKELKAYSTKFANAHGLPSEATQYTTAQDMYLIFKQAMQYPFFRKTIGYSSVVIHSKGGRKIVLNTHNTSFKKGWKKKVHGKTGYTRKAKACFVGYVPKGDRVLIVGVFGCTRRWDDVKYIIRKYGGVHL